VLGLLPTEINGLQSGFWHWTAGFDINTAGFVIVGMFILTWAGALAFWRVGRVEERWGAGLAEDRRQAPAR
jgi:nickel/cobalt transporter (NiCoT) family protein